MADDDADESMLVRESARLKTSSTKKPVSAQTGTYSSEVIG